MKELDKYQILVIRACKACRSHDETIRRIKKILSIRCGLKPSCIENGYMYYYVTKIIEDYNLTTLTKFVDQITDHKFQNTFFKDINRDPILSACFSIIALSVPKEQFPNFIPQARFRNKRLDNPK